MFSFAYLTKKTAILLNTDNYKKNKDYCNKSTQKYISRIIKKNDLERKEILKIKFITQIE